MWWGLDKAKYFSVHYYHLDRLLILHDFCFPALHSLLAASAPWQCHLMTIKFWFISLSCVTPISAQTSAVSS